MYVIKKLKSLTLVKQPFSHWATTAQWNVEMIQKYILWIICYKFLLTLAFSASQSDKKIKIVNLRDNQFD